MGWKKGESGNPKGPPKTRPFTDALHMALAEECEIKKKRKLRLIAENLVDAAVEGEPWAIKEVMDRVDGKPAQTADISVTGDHTVTHVSESLPETTAWLADILRERQAGKTPPSRKN